MRIFGKSAAQKRIDEDAVKIAELKAENARLLAEIARTGVLLTEADDEIRWRRDRTAFLAAERDTLRAQLQPFLDRQEKAKANLRQYRKPGSAPVRAAMEAM